MRIAITSDAYYPMINGVAAFTHNLAEGLAARGHEVLVVVPSFNGLKHKDKDGTLTVQYLSSKRFPFYPDQINEITRKKEVLGLKLPRLAYKNGLWLSVKPNSELKKALKEFHPDVIHAQTVGPMGLATMNYVRRHKTPLVSTGHSYPDNFTGQFKMLRPVKKPVDAVVRAYMASFLKHSEYATMPTEMAIEDLVPKNRKRFTVSVEALSNGVDLSHFKPGKPSAAVLKKYDINMERPRALYVGRVDPEKSIETVVAAFSKVIKKLPEAELLIVGDGISRPELEKQAASLGISENVRMLGKIMPPELYEIYKTGTIFATASETETQGIVLIEAAATGLPLVAVNGGAVKELCQNGKNGVLCKPGGDVDGMARAMVKILSDADLRKKYSEGSLEVAKKHDLHRTLKRFEEIYEQAIEINSGAR